MADPSQNLVQHDLGEACNQNPRESSPTGAESGSRGLTKLEKKPSGKLDTLQHFPDQKGPVPPPVINLEFGVHRLMQ